MPSDRPFRLLDLPQEIRAMIFVELLVVENWIYDRDFDDTGVLQTIRRRENVGCVEIEGLEPSRYDSLSMKRTSFLVSGWQHYQSQLEFTTYTLRTGKSNLQSLHINRQLYQEASAVFYSRNFFYAGGMTPTVTVPFLKDRGNRSLGSLRKLSIVYPSPLADLYDFDYLRDDIEVNESMWEDICCYISLRLPSLAHLDLRVERGREVSLQDHAYTLDEWDSLQTKGDFPPKRRKELASLDQGIKVTVSAPGWPDLDYLGDFYVDDFRNVLFDPLLPWLDESIRRIRAQNVLSVVSDEDRHFAIKNFWAARREARVHSVYILDDSDHKYEYLKQTDHWTDDGYDEVDERAIQNAANHPLKELVAK